MKTCKRCNEEKELSNYYTQTDRRDGNTYYAPYCKTCCCLRAKEYRNIPGWKEAVVLRRYKISKLDFDSMLKDQDGKCKICERKFSVALKIQIDHCHRTKQIRGMLCIKCNTALGKFNDDPALLRMAALYVECEGDI